MIKDQAQLDAWMRMRAIKAAKAISDARWEARKPRLSGQANLAWIDAAEHRSGSLHGAGLPSNPQAKHRQAARCI